MLPPTHTLVLHSTAENSILLVHYVTHGCDKEWGRQNNGPEAEFQGQTGLKNGCVTLDRVPPSMSAALILTRILWTYKGAQGPPEGPVRDYVDSLSSGLAQSTSVSVSCCYCHYRGLPQELAPSTQYPRLRKLCLQAAILWEYGSMPQALLSSQKTPRWEGCFSSHRQMAWVPESKLGKSLLPGDEEVLRPSIFKQAIFPALRSSLHALTRSTELVSNGTACRYNPFT